MKMYVMCILTNHRYNGLPRTHSLEFEVTESAKNFIRTEKKFDYIPFRFYKINEYSLCTGYACFYLFGRDKNKVLDMWKEIMNPTTRFIDMI